MYEKFLGRREFFNVVLRGKNPSFLLFLLIIGLLKTY